MHGNGADEASLERTYQTLQPLDPVAAGTILREAKQILDRFGVTFFLRQGTCLGAIRDNGFIPWDDDVDLGSVIGLHGFTEDQIEPIVNEFRACGFYAKFEPTKEYLTATMMKSYTRLDWVCYRIVDDNIIHFPGVPVPVHLVTRLKRIDFAGDTFLVPNPPEDYLSAKYGPDWMTPKNDGYEQDVLSMITDDPTEQRRSTTGDSHDSNGTRVRVLGQDGEPVHDALVRVAGLGSIRTNEQGYAEFHLPEARWYSVVISHGSHEELPYQERLAQGMTYVYRPDPSTTSGRFLALSTE